MGNFFKDNPDLMFTLEHLDLAPVAELVEHGYKNAENDPFALKMEGRPLMENL